MNHLDAAEWLAYAKHLSKRYVKERKQLAKDSDILKIWVMACYMVACGEGWARIRRVTYLTQGDQTLLEIGIKRFMLKPVEKKDDGTYYSVSWQGENVDEYRKFRTLEEAERVYEEKLKAWPKIYLVSLDYYDGYEDHNIKEVY